jgi:hypothetical protein
METWVLRARGQKLVRKIYQLIKHCIFSISYAFSQYLSPIIHVKACIINSMNYLRVQLDQSVTEIIGAVQKYVTLLGEALNSALFEPFPGKENCQKYLTYQSSI